MYQIDKNREAMTLIIGWIEIPECFKSEYEKILGLNITTT